MASPGAKLLSPGRWTCEMLRPEKADDGLYRLMTITFKVSFSPLRHGYRISWKISSSPNFFFPILI